MLRLDERRVHTCVLETVDPHRECWFRVSYGDSWGHAAIARSSVGLMLSLAGLDGTPMSAAHA